MESSLRVPDGFDVKTILSFFDKNYANGKKIYAKSQISDVKQIPLSFLSFQAKVGNISTFLVIKGKTGLIQDSSCSSCQRPRCEHAAALAFLLEDVALGCPPRLKATALEEPEDASVDEEDSNGHEDSTNDEEDSNGEEASIDEALQDPLADHVNHEEKQRLEKSIKVTPDNIIEIQSVNQDNSIEIQSVNQTNEEISEETFIVKEDPEDASMDDENSNGHEDATNGEEASIDEVLVKHEDLIDTCDKTEKEVHPCAHCDQVFDSLGVLNTHIELRHYKKLNENPYCHECDKTFTSRKGLKVHMDEQHNAFREIFTCTDCHKTFRSKKGYKRHMQQQHGKEKPSEIEDSDLVCPECGKECKTKLGLKYHIDAIHRENNEVHKCPECDKTSNTIGGIKRHIEYVHNKPRQEIEATSQVIKDEPESNLCLECGKAFKTEKGLKLHIEVIHQNQPHESETIGKSLLCSECGKTYKTQNSLKIHIKDVHKATMEKCPIEGCEKSFKLKRQLNIHMTAKHSKGSSRCYLCPYCPYTTHYATSMTIHINASHEKVKELKCEKCDFTTFYPFNLKNHVAKQHDFNCVKCDYCDFSTRLKSQLQHHINRNHIKEGFWLYCGLNGCDMKTTHSTVLRKHRMRAHKLVKNPFPCQTCEFETKTYERWKKHMKETHDEK